MKTELKTEHEFEKLTVPFNKAEMEKLEKDILCNGCLNPIVTWNGLILDGHKRYRICVLEGIDFEMTEMYFSSREDAVMWVCRERTYQLSKNRLIYKYLVGKWYSVGMVINRKKEINYLEGEIFISRNKRRTYRTSQDIGLELGLNHATIERYKRISVALDKISEKDPILFEMFMQGEYKASYEKILEMSARSQRTLQQVRRRFQKGINQESYTGTVMETNKLEAVTSAAEELPIIVGIKDMPEFDPDMALRGLTFTIPTWMNAMARARSKTDMTIVSDLMRRQLADVLDQFRQQIDQMLEVLINDSEQ